MTPGLSHLWVLKQLDRTGLSHWLLGFGAFLTLTIMSVIMLISVGYPDPDMYKNSIAFTAIISFFLVFYIAMGRDGTPMFCNFLPSTAKSNRHWPLFARAPESSFSNC